MIKVKLRAYVFCLVVVCFSLLPSTSHAIFQSEVVPEAYASIELRIDSGDLERTTTTTVAGTRYPVTGVFTYDLVGFTQVSDELTYTLPTVQPRTFFFSASIIVKGNSPSCRVHFGVFVNDVEVNPASITGTYLKTAGEAQATGGMSFIIHLEQNDEIHLVLWSDSAGEEVVTTHLNAVMFPIFWQKR